MTHWKTDSHFLFHWLLHQPIVYKLVQAVQTYTELYDKKLTQNVAVHSPPQNQLLNYNITQ